MIFVRVRYVEVESMIPAAFRNASKAERFAREGATTRRGDPITEDINPYNVVMQGLELCTARVHTKS